VQTKHGTPLSRCCDCGHVSVAELLSKDPRVDATLPDEEGCTPLWWASCNGHHEVIEWLIASGKDLGDMNRKGHFYLEETYTALEIAREEKNTEAVGLLERFVSNPMQTRHEIRVKLGFPDELAAEIFALTVFLCEGLLQLKSPLATAAFNPDATRFFSIASKLPMELQMVLCRRAVGSMKQNIRSAESEVAFKYLAWSLLSQPN